MTDLAAVETEFTPVGAEPTFCPMWCLNELGGDDHTHVSRELHVEALGRPLSAKLMQVPGEDGPRALVNGHVATLEQTESFAYSLLRLVSEATMADPGLGFVESLASRGDISLEQMARASGLEPDRLRLQREGEQVLTIHEFDLLALAVAQLSVTSNG